jgi:hypothetical protein
MKILLLRDVIDPNFTLGKLHLDGNLYAYCETLEDPVREIEGQPVAQWKVYGDTAIPRGTYRVVIDMSRRFGRLMLHLLDVPGFTGIRIHGANTTANVQGCIGVGKDRTPNGIRMSKDILADLEKRVALALARGDEVWIEVR